MIGAEGIVGAAALYGFISSLLQPPIRPSWVWLCLILAVALFAEVRVVHRLVGTRTEDSEVIKMTPKQLADYTKRLQESPSEDT